MKNYQPDFISSDEPLLSVPEAARRLGLARTTVHNMIRGGRLGYLLKAGVERKIYHIPESALAALTAVRRARRKLKSAEAANRRCVRRFKRLREELGESEKRRRKTTKP